MIEAIVFNHQMGAIEAPTNIGITLPDLNGYTVFMILTLHYGKRGHG